MTFVSFGGGDNSWHLDGAPPSIGSLLDSNGRPFVLF